MSDALQKLIDNYLYSGRKPRGDEIAITLTAQPRIFERESIIKRVMNKFNSFVETFIEGI